MKIEFLLIPIALIVHLFIHIDGIGPVEATKKWSILGMLDFVGAFICFLAAFLRFGGIQRELGSSQTSNFVWCLLFLAVGLTDLLAEWTVKRNGPAWISGQGVRAMAHAILFLLLIGCAVFLEIYKYQPWVCVLLAGIAIIIMAPLYYGYLLGQKDE